ncbi:YkvA family protein [Devosia sp. CN2-171]|uniref:YkvA family protein n=1 Tax=Devosia sp. CN2-171 TaxID=3400909 RepID=UPI003BF803A9
MIKFSLLARFVTFRKELATLWRAFLAPETPVHLKALMLLVPAYLLSPIDLIPDVIPLLGWVDDFVIIPLMVGWIVRMLPVKAPIYQRSADGAKVIDGEYRRR